MVGIEYFHTLQSSLYLQFPLNRARLFACASVSSRWLLSPFSVQLRILCILMMTTTEIDRWMCWWPGNKDPIKCSSIKWAQVDQSRWFDGWMDKLSCTHTIQRRNVVHSWKSVRIVHYHLVGTRKEKNSGGRVWGLLASLSASVEEMMRWVNERAH